MPSVFGIPSKTARKSLSSQIFAESNSPFMILQKIQSAILVCLNWTDLNNLCSNSELKNPSDVINPQILRFRVCFLSGPFMTPPQYLKVLAYE